MEMFFLFFDGFILNMLIDGGYEVVGMVDCFGEYSI